MTLQPITTKRIYLQIAEQMAKAIRDGAYPVGSALPPERVLAEQLQVSRASIREALVALQLMGLIDVRPGDRAFVMASSPKGMTSDELRQEVSAADLMEARKLIESAIAELAAEMATDEDLLRLQDSIELMEREAQVDAPRDEGDYGFHRHLAMATKNSALEVIANLLLELRREHVWDALGKRALTHEHRLVYLEAHRKIFACISQRDCLGAHRAMTEHLETVEKHFFESAT
jgi:DNA-binding FadR family transcriptional regulator